MLTRRLLRPMGGAMPSAWRAAMPSGWRAAAAAPARRAASSAPAAGDGFEPRTAILMQLDDRSGALHEVLKYFWKHDVNLTRIESRPTASDGTFDFFVDFEGRPGEPEWRSRPSALWRPWSANSNRDIRVCYCVLGYIRVY